MNGCDDMDCLRVNQFEDITAERDSLQYVVRIQNSAQFEDERKSAHPERRV